MTCSTALLSGGAEGGDVSRLAMISKSVSKSKTGKGSKGSKYSGNFGYRSGDRELETESHTYEEQYRCGCG